MSSGWKTKSLGTVVTLQRGYDLPYRLRKQGPIPIVTSSGIADTHSEAKVRGPGVITGRYGTIGQVFYVKCDFWPHNTTLYVRDFHGNNPEFVAYLLQTIDFHSHSGKSGVPGVNRNDLHQVEVLLPLNIAEQVAIAEALSDSDALFESLEQLIVKKRNIKQGAMEELLTGKKRLPGFCREWEVKTLRELGQWRGGGTPSKRNVEFWSGHIPWASPKDFKGTTIAETEDYITTQAVERSSTAIVTKNSILIVTRSGVLRHTVPIATNAVDLAINQDVKALTVLDTAMPAYILQALLTFSDKIKESTVKVGTTVESIDFEALCRFKIPIPPLPEQTAIAEILSDMDAEIVALEARLDKARQVKQGMMQELLTGRMRLF